MGWKKRDRSHHPNAPFAKLVSNQQTSHLLRTVSAWKLISLNESVTVSLSISSSLFKMLALLSLSLSRLLCFLLPPSLSIRHLPLSWPNTALLIWLFLKLSLTITRSSSVSQSRPPSALSSVWRQRREGDRLSLSDWSGKTTPSAAAYRPECMCDIRLVRYPT